MKSLTTFAALFLATSSASAQYNASTPAAISTITIKPACPTAAPADVKVTRSAVAIPSCEAGSGANATKPSVMSVSGYGAGSTGGAGAGVGGASASATKTGSVPPVFTGGASSVGVGGVMVALGGLAVFVL